MSNVEIFKGRPVLPGDLSGEAVVTSTGFNATASYMEVLFMGSESGICLDADNKDLYKLDLSGKILCLPQTIGSSAAATVYAVIVERKIAPKAMLFSKKIDSLAACGLVMADNWVEGDRIVAIDQLGDEFLESIKTGNQIDVAIDGTVTVHGS